ncbi:hypothetical protein [Bacillus mycoides]|uniref:hypothetical protein n=1 Tax=Bacillus mycoides TaxID=1405 RepID=UPI00159036C1|nr:hypothetical protein [Bacillus mycoides]
MDSSFTFLGIVGYVVVKKNAKVGGFICISIVYLLQGVLLLIGGLMGIFRKDKTAVSA